MTVNRRAVLVRTLGAAAAASAGLVKAQGAPYPNRPITLVVPVSAGGQGDIIGRTVASKLGELLGQSVVVENRAGANTMLATRAVASAPADGYTLLLAFTVIVQNPLLYEGKAGYDLNTDLRPVAMLGSNAVALVSGPGSGFRSIRDFVERARQSPKPLTYATVGHGSSAHLYMDMFARQARIDLVHVPYKGESQFLPDLTAGRLDAGLVSPMTVRQFAGDGKLTPLAVTGRKRNIVLPDVPTFLEQGIAGTDEDAWAGIFAPARTPGAIIERLSSEIGRAVLEPSTRDKLVAIGLEPTGLGSAEFTQIVKRGSESWTRIIKTSGITLRE